MKTFVFDDELCLNESLTMIDGYLWMGTILADKIKPFIEDSVNDIENLNLYAFYHVGTGMIGCLGTYYIGDNQKEYVLPLTREEREEVKTEMNAYCLERYGESCIEFINAARKAEKLPPLFEALQIEQY